MCEPVPGGSAAGRDIVMNLPISPGWTRREFKEIDLNAALRATIEILGSEFRKKQVRAADRPQ